MSSFLFIVPDDWYLLTHRKEIISSLLDDGHSVSLICNIQSKEENFPDLLKKCKIYELDTKRDGFLRFIIGSFKILKIISQENVDLIHSITIRSLLYSILSIFVKNKSFVISIAGAGGLNNFTGIKKLILNFIIFSIRQLSNIRDIIFIFQNTIDRSIFFPLMDNEALDDVYLIRGAGVDIANFSNSLVDVPRTRIFFASRLLQSKGILTFIAALNIIEGQHNLRPTIAARLDKRAEDALSLKSLNHALGSLSCDTYWDVEDISQLMRESAIFVLPTLYAEGLPKVVLEAMAGGATVITTDWPDVDAVIRHQDNGIVIPKQDLTPQRLASVMLDLARSADKRDSLSKQAFIDVSQSFSVTKVIKAHRQIYARMLTSVGR